MPEPCPEPPSPEPCPDPKPCPQCDECRQGFHVASFFGGITLSLILCFVAFVLWRRQTFGSGGYGSAAGGMQLREPLNSAA